MQPRVAIRQALERLFCFKDVLRPFTIVMVPFPRKELDLLWNGFFIIPYWTKLNDLHGRPMVNFASGARPFIFTTRLLLPQASRWDGFLLARWRMKLIAFCAGLKANLARLTALRAQAKLSACSCAGTSWLVSFITLAEKHRLVGRADPICP